MRGTAIKLKADAFKTHLWIVVSDVHPVKKVVLAFNLTDRDHYPGCCCILSPGEHEYIEKLSAVRYFSPKLWDPQQIPVFLPIHRHGQFFTETIAVKKLPVLLAVFMDQPGELHVESRCCSRFCNSTSRSSVGSCRRSKAV